MYIHVLVYLLHEYMHGSKKKSPGWWAVRAQLIEKSPDKIFVLNLFYSGGPMVISNFDF